MDINKLSALLLLLCTIFVSWSANLGALSSAVAVPCYYKHFKYLPGFLESLTRQTRLPKEVVISLSQVEHLPAEEVDALEAGPWPFRLEILRRAGVFMEGSNRTNAARHCSADVILCIDADDIPHPQRVEAVVQLFEVLPEADLVLCGHAYCLGESIVCERAIPFFSPTEYAEMRFELGPHTWLRLSHKGDLQHWSSGIHNGAPSLRRTLLDTGVYWSDLKNGADLEFNSAVIARQHPTYLIQLPLLHYFNGRSSAADVGR